MSIKDNKLVDLKITDIVQGGEGLGKVDNFVIFVPQAFPEDELKVKIISAKPSYARGLIREIITPSPYRVKPECTVTKECGGCQWQELDYKKQLDFKLKNLVENLEKIAKLDKNEIESANQGILGMEVPYLYRNKAQFPFGMAGSKMKAGFYAPKSHNIVEFDKCKIQSDLINKVFWKIKKLIKRNEIPIYNEKTKEGLLRHVVIRHSFALNQILLGFVTTSIKFPKLEKIIEEITQEFHQIVGIVQNINSKDSNFILGDKNITVFGKDHIIEILGTLQYKISLNSFFQVNPVQAVHLYNQVLEYSQVNKNSKVLDAYAGTGSIALWLAKEAKEARGIEVLKEAVNDGIENAKLNNIDNFSFKLGKVEEVLPEVLEDFKPDLLVLDPPRKGCEDYMFDAIGGSSVNRVVYVSCNPSTLSRDAKFLADNGFKLTKFKAFDMFPHTHHLETVACFERE
jgi:23S rRNA (uracil1939-C5)-methyltransferase